MPISFGDLFVSKGKNVNQTPANNSLDGKETDKFVINIPKQFGTQFANGHHSKSESDMQNMADQSSRIPWGTIPFLKPVQFQKEHHVEATDKKAPGTISISSKWTTTRVRQKKKELNMFSPTSF